MQHSDTMLPDLKPASSIDREGMAEMWEDAGPALFRRMAALFDGERQRSVTQIQSAMNADDRKALAFAAHALRGAAAYVCAAGLRDLAMHLEREAHDATPERLLALVAAIRAAADAAGPALAAAIADISDKAA